MIYSACSAASVHGHTNAILKHSNSETYHSMVLAGSGVQMMAVAQVGQLLAFLSVFSVLGELSDARLGN